MVHRPVRWKRFGVATLACFSIVLTALAAQVSPPNAESPAPVAGKAGAVERKEVTLGAAQLDRYVGQYQLGDSMLFTVTRTGPHLTAQLTGQPPAPIYPESENKFFYKVVDAQVEFASDAATLFQNGNVVKMPRIDAASAEQLKANLAAKVDSQVATPGTEAAVRRLSESIAAGKPNYHEMTPELAAAVKAQLATLQSSIASLGALQAVTFKGVTSQGADLYQVKYQNGALGWRVVVDGSGKVSYALALPDF